MKHKPILLSTLAINWESVFLLLFPNRYHQIKYLTKLCFGIVCYYIWGIFFVSLICDDFIE